MLTAQKTTTLFFKKNFRKDADFKKTVLLLFFVLFFAGIPEVFSQSRIRHREYSEAVKELRMKTRECQREAGENCIEFLKEAVRYVEKHNECVPCVELELGVNLMRIDEIDSAEFYLKKVQKGAGAQRDSVQWELMADSYNLLAALAGIKGNPEEQIRFTLESIKYGEKMGDFFQVASMKANLAAVYQGMKNHEKAISLAKEALGDLTRIGATRNKGLIASNIASSFHDLDKNDSAIFWSRRTIALAKEEEDVLSETAGYYLLAIALDEAKSDSALYYAERAVDRAERLNDTYYLATSYNIMGSILLDSDYSKAKDYLVKSIENYRKLGRPTGIDAPMKSLGKEALIHRDYETAARYLDEYINYNDSVVTADNRRLIHEMETQYETEKKEKQIAEQELKIQKHRSTLLVSILGGLLAVFILGGVYLYTRRGHKLRVKQMQQEKENAILNSFIQGEERERNRISEELHDGVAAMIGAAKMSLDAVPHLPEEKQKEQLEKIKTILESTHADVRHIAHNLMPTVLEKEGLIAAVEHFAKEINETNLVSLTVKNENSRAEDLPKNLQLMLFRVIQELVNNIIKHSQAQNAEIKFSQTAQGLNIEVIDDGIGFDTDPDAGNQGLYSISQRLKSIGGSFKFIRRKDRGMRAIAEVKI